jgi:D-glycero-D-manno-heptose 1,7-bisphosphate phosphatase
MGIKQAVILAGGMGTRLYPLTKDKPKPMIEFYGKPFLEYLVQRIVDQGIEDILILVGYHADKIEDHFEDGSKWGIKIHYSNTPVEDNTGTRIRKAAHLFQDEFILMYCDNNWPFDLVKMYTQYQESNVDGQVVIYNNLDSYTEHNVILEEGKVKVYDKKRETPNLSGVDIGFIILKTSILDDMPEDDFLFETYLFPKLIAHGKLGAYVTGHRYYSVGSFARLELTRDYLSSCKYVLIDRDGVLNEKAPKADYVKCWSEWSWMEGAKEGLKHLVDQGYKLILITNQAGIAREKMTENDLHSIHFMMKEELAEIGVKFEAIYFCPHGWDEDCLCRKPKPGMLWNAQRDFSFDLSKTYFIGDDPRDMEAADAAGAKGLFKPVDTSLLSLVEKHF